MKATDAFSVMESVNVDSWAWEPKYKDVVLSMNGDSKIIKSLLNFNVDPKITHIERELFFEVRGHKFRGFLDYEKGDFWHGDIKSTYKKDYLNQQYLYMEAKSQNQEKRPHGFEILEYKNNMNVVKFDYYEAQMKDTLSQVGETIEKIKKALRVGKFPVNSKSKFYCSQLCRKTDCVHSGNKR